MSEIKVRVNGHSLTKDGTCAGAQFEANSTHLHIEFGSDWDNFTKTVTFWDALGEKPTKIDIYPHDAIDTVGKVYSVPVPGEVTKHAGMITFVIDGYSDQDKRVLKRSVEDKLKILPSRKSDNAVNASLPTTDQMTQLQSEIAEIEDDILDIMNKTENAKFYAGEAEKSATEAATSVSEATELFQNAIESAGKAYNYQKDASDSADRAERAIAKNATIGDNGNWFTWDAKTEQYVDTGVRAQAGSEVYIGSEPPDSADVWVIPDGEYRGFFITEDDVATDSKAGIVTLAETSFMPNKKGKAVITEDLVDYAVYLATHKQMNNSYDPLDLNTCHEINGAQGDLPVSYNAVKRYVDDVALETKAYVEKLLGSSTIGKASITLYANRWVQGKSENMWYQEVDVANATEYSKVDLQPDVEQMLIFYEKDLTFVTENDGGKITVYCIGQRPANDYTIQATITEVNIDGE